MTTSLKVKDLSYALYSDSALNAARAYGIAFQVDKFSVAKLRAFGINLEKASGEGHNQLPVPSVFLIDSHGIIRWVYSNPNYKVRPDNTTLIEAARLVNAETKKDGAAVTPLPSSGANRCV